MRKPSGSAFIDFDDYRDAQDAIHDLDCKHNWRVKLFYYFRSGGDGSDCDSGTEELDGGNGRRCSQTHPSNCRSPGEHPYLSTTLTQTGTPISCLKSSMSDTWAGNCGIMSFTPTSYSKSIKLADGSRTLIQGIGNVTITPTLPLSFVFYLPLQLIISK